MWDKTGLIVSVIGTAIVLGLIVYKVIFGPRQLKKGDKAPELKMKGRPEVRMWTTLWLDKVRRDSKPINDDTPISAEEVQQGLRCAAYQYNTSLTCNDGQKILTVGDFVETVEAQLPKPPKNPEQKT